MNTENKLFALDIGTRSVVGIILDKSNDQLKVVDVLSYEHTERAMLDGQIHDIIAVSKIINKIKGALEIKHGPLSKVCVAAAGRALKTKRAKVAIPIQGKPAMQKQDILHLELSAVQQAQALVADENQLESYTYYCVGYSVLYYHLDGEEIGNLTEQQGEEASVEIIATFLPKVVVESLISALHLAQLDMQALTLEPIAAINVLIPASMRRLNIALVDIGAGTSDIAITNLGTVVAYGMVPIAGDEITEAISDQLLLDFPDAEQAKRQLYSLNNIIVTDILGLTSELSKEEILSQISPSINRLADAICHEILQLNNQISPKAVMLVGGGSLTPLLPEKVAEKLHLPANRVAIRGISAIPSLDYDEQSMQGPELVTPIGIAIAAERSPVQYKTIYVNEQPVRLFEVNKLTIGDCVLATGIKVSRLYGKPGMAMIVMLNGQSVTIPGEYGGTPTILRNGESCSFDEQVENGDRIYISKGKDGIKTNVKIKDLVDEIPLKDIVINGKSYQIQANITCNGLSVSPEKWIEDRDQIECTVIEKIDELLLHLQLHECISALTPFKIKLNEIDTVLPPFSGKIYKNGREVKANSSFEHLDKISIQGYKLPTVKELAVLKQWVLSYAITVTFNNKKLTLSKTIAQIKRDDVVLTEEDILYQGDSIHLEKKKIEPFIFQDLFQYAQIDLPTHTNGHFVLLRNGKETSFHSPIYPGDQLSIIWPISKTV
ncbi:cell division FtsA domain-containing protein [Bacillus sp. 03113]|uniref:cell division FtsA domain-containing protein n=1 Tax=Bacillus sp. 03113 TaxID=2578211 RepID=UPI001142F30C|nr:cell division FtsA domain-containing protein [Bacillus sp. 03113]